MAETVTEAATTTPARAKTRIQRENETRILRAALEVFSEKGFHGATLDRIAGAANMSKPNLLYYFRNKEEIHIALLSPKILKPPSFIVLGNHQVLETRLHRCPQNFKTPIVYRIGGPQVLEFKLPCCPLKY